MKILRKLQHYMGPRRGLLPLAMILSGLSALTGIIPYALIWLIVRDLLISGGMPTDMERISAFAWWAVGTSVVGIVFYFAALMSSHLAAFRVESNLRKEAMRRIVDMPLGFFDSTTSGRIRKIIDDNASITHSFLAHQMPDLAATVLVPVAALGLIFFFDWRLGAASLVPMLFAGGLMAIMIGGKSQNFMREYMNALEEMNTEAVEYVRGIPVVKVFQQTLFSFKNFHQSILCYKEMVTRYTQAWEHPMSAYTVLINSFVYILAPVAILLIGRTGEYMDILLDFFLFVLVTPLFSQCIMRSMYLSQAVGQASEAIARLDELTAVAGLPVPEAVQSPQYFDIDFDRVTFTYPGARQRAVDGVSFKIREGETVALVGASGSGKTTLARLVPRFWDVDAGRISIGGVDVRKIPPAELMQRVSFVFQRPRLFKNSLLENIRCGRPDASIDEVMQAADSACCREIIERLPNGLRTEIGVNGTFLSGGEQQRIALARALLKDAPIVLLDEATAFSDPENEHLIQSALRNLMHGKTVLMIAHRLSSITDADRILVMDRGRLVEQGTHEKLLSENGIYRRMWDEYRQSTEWTLKKS